MKLSAKQITITGVLLAICIISQFFQNTSTFLTGPIINTCLILAALGGGLASGMILAVSSPVFSFLITGSPIIAAIPAILPCIMLGNAILVFFTFFLTGTIRHKAGPYLGMLTGVVLKSLFMGISIALILIPGLLPAASKMTAQMQVLQYTFSFFQLITGAIGCVYAAIILIPLNKVMK